MIWIFCFVFVLLTFLPLLQHTNTCAPVFETLNQHYVIMSKQLEVLCERA